MTESYASIHVRYPDGGGAEFAIQQEVVAIGRNPDNQVVLQHGSVSRVHARLHIREGRLYLEDLGSTQGTFVDGRRLPANQPTLLEAGQSVRLGAVDLSLQPTPSPAPQAAPQAAPQPAPQVAPRPAARSAQSLAPPASASSTWLKIGAALAAGGATLALVCLLVVALAWWLRARKPPPRWSATRPP